MQKDLLIVGRIARNLRNRAVPALLLVTTGCSTGVNLQVQSQVPVPLVTKLPLDLGVYYNENFREYVFKENAEDRQDWVIDNRESRISLFNQVLPSMFRSVSPVEDITSPGNSNLLDAIIEPEVVEMQLALPSETNLDLYEAWIRYNIKIHNPQGDLISQWQVTGYGKSPVETFSSNSKGLNNAIEIAMRDIGAKIALGFPHAPGVREWLSAKIDCSQFAHLC